MNMHPTYRARRLRALSLGALLLAVVCLGNWFATGLLSMWLLSLVLYAAAFAFAVMMRRFERGIA